MKSLVEENKKWFDEVWKKLDKKLVAVAKRSFDKIPYTAVDGVHDDKSKEYISWWTNGFWPGLMWIMYDGTKRDVYKDTAINAEKILDGALEEYNGLHHDVGFMWHISSGLHYRLLGDKQSRVRTLYAANVLAGRYNIDGKFITAWNGQSQQGWTIIDSMMNIPLLYWASREIGDARFERIAKAQADMAMRDHVRPDGSVVHIVSHDTQTGDVIETFGGQGYEVGSSWSRGQAWAVYGFALSYLHTGDEKYLDTAKKVANYFIAACCDDYLPKCDFRSPEEPVIYDSTAGAITACGLIELSKHVGVHEKGMYLNAAVKMLKAMEEKFCNWEENVDYIVGYGTERYGSGEHMAIIYGDFYFAEAIYMLRGGEIKIW